MGHALLVAVLIGLYGYRMTRLAVKDSIFDQPRDWVLRTWPDVLSELIICPWCVSAYITGVPVLWFVVWGSVAAPFLVWMAAWSITVIAYQAAELLTKYATK